MNNFLIEKSLTDLFFEHAARQPNQVAITSDTVSITFKELAEVSLQVANYLQFIGVGPDECIGIFVEPCIELFVGIWGILISGSAYMPLSPEYPQERLKYMLENSAAKIVFTQDSHKDKLVDLVPPNTRIISINDTQKFKIADAKNLKFKNTPRSTDLAYVIYTSGSTGKPKGVMIEHRSIVNQMEWLAKKFALNHRSIVLQKTPMSFDAAQWEILATVFGARIVIGDSGIYKNPEKLVQTIIKFDVTTLQCVPTLLQALIDTEEFYSCKSLKQLFSGGEALAKNLAMVFIKTLPTCDLINLYGPTECTINTSAYIVDPLTVENASHTISIGVPADNTYYYILNDSNAPTSEKEIGELHIGGIGLSRGYLHQPELTAQKFIDNPFCADDKQMKLYKSGDLAHWNADGTVQYVGRNDFQVKLRGFRIELGEIKACIENHDWVKLAAVILKIDSHTGYQNLIAFIELNSKEAALMDQGNHDAHHQSKQSKTQVMMQLSNKGCREQETDYGKSSFRLPGKNPTLKQSMLIFTRKTYRFFEGGEVTQEDILRLLAQKNEQNTFIELTEFSYDNFGEVFRYFGQLISKERLLPKYGYASPGALYATQMYLELNGIGTLPAGYYYYDPVQHQLLLINDKRDSHKIEIKIHFIGKKSAIEPIYKNNIQEVLEIETGHMVGLFEKILPEYGLGIKDCEYMDSITNYLDVAVEDLYLGTFQIVSGKKDKISDSVDIYVQIHPGKMARIRPGQYIYKEGQFEKISDELILRKHVIAINQAVYDRASFGITLISTTSKNWMKFINLGRKLQKLQINDLNIGSMSSGYSSKTGWDLPSAKRIQVILNQSTGPSYFFVCGKITDEQKYSQGMQEDAVHMKGPAEMIKDDLINFLPDHMLPNRIIILDKMPLSVNGKIAFNELYTKQVEFIPQAYIEPTTDLEKTICAIWKKEMQREIISIRDNFFELGGNSLIAVKIVNQINKQLNFSLPLQILFKAPTIERLALSVCSENITTTSRLVKLQEDGLLTPIYCWPGLGGYCMNLRLLAAKMGVDRPFYGVQAYGINFNEIPYESIHEMAAEDIKLIKKSQPNGPYILWGYSFGACVAFEVAYQLEKAGDIVENIILIAPGSPQLKGMRTKTDKASYRNKAYLMILFSVFMGSISHTALNDCLKTIKNDDGFINYITNLNPNLDAELVKKIMHIVAKTYEFKRSYSLLKNRHIEAPITILKAAGDDISFLEKSMEFSDFFEVLDLKSDHYSLLKPSGIDELIKKIHLEQTIIFKQKMPPSSIVSAVHNPSKYDVIFNKQRG